LHIPDGFLDTKTAATAAVLSTTVIGVALRSVKRTLPPAKVPLMGLTAAFVFAAQMLNFPVAAGTSGHLMGAVLAAILLGPGAAVLVMSCVLIVQCLLFADGGLLALGANVLNMAVIGSLTGYAVFAAVMRVVKGDRGRLVAAGFAAWCSTVVASVACAGELAWSGTVSWAAAFPAMANVHMIIGLAEGLITTLVIAAIAKARPDFLDTGMTPEPRSARFIYGVVVLVGLLIFVSPFASEWPDGLEKVAAYLGFEHRAIQMPAVPTPLSDYAFPGTGSAAGATALAGAVGTVVVFLLSFVLARILLPKSEIN
jgi:cobalt/nickel transport system permease protein